MSKYIPGNQKHLTPDDHKYIEKSLNQGLASKEMDTVHSSNESKKVLLTDRDSEFGDPVSLETVHVLIHY